MNDIPIRVASMGPADHGKSTLFGYLVLNHINSGPYWEEIKKLQAEKEWFSADRIYAYIFDRTLEERRGQFVNGSIHRYQGASRVVTHFQCVIGNKKYMFIDVPGHDKFLKNATSGVFQAQCGVLVIAAPDLEDVIRAFEAKEKTPKKHLSKTRVNLGKISNVLLCPILVRVYGLSNLVVVISKMDRVDYDKYYFDLAKKELLPRIAKYSGLREDSIPLIPTSIAVSNHYDINVVTPARPGQPLSWHRGPTLLEALTRINPLRPSDGSLLIPVETVYLKRVVNTPLILTGRIMRGNVSRGQTVQVVPLHDRSTTLYNPTKIEGRVKTIHQRDQSKHLPWLGKLDSDKIIRTDSFEAGHVVSINLHLTPKFSWAKNSENYFRKGCIITGRNEALRMGNVLKAEVFVPVYSRPILPVEAWVTYLFGKNKGDALVLSARDTEGPFMEEEGEEYAGHFVETHLLLDFPMAYPSWFRQDGDYLSDIVLRHHQSFCGGVVQDLFFPEAIEASWDGGLPFVELDEIEKKFEDLIRLNKLSCKWKLELEEEKWSKLTAFNPSSKDVRVFFKNLERLLPNFSAATISITPRP